MINKIPVIKPSIRTELKVIISISFIVFLFFLFFQPFPVDRFDFNNNLIFLTGFAFIIFLNMVFFRFIVHRFLKGFITEDYESGIPYFMNYLLILVFSSVAFAFYAHYVGYIQFTFYNMLKLFLICLSTVLVLWQHDLLTELKSEIESLITEKILMQKQVEKFEQDYLNISLEFSSENQSEKFPLLISDVAFIKSADNYIEIVYRDGDGYSKKLLRNTLKSIEHQLKSYNNFIRCHRICIVNTHFIEHIKRDFNNYKLAIKDYNEHIPVSRQYLLKIKESV